MVCVITIQQDLIGFYMLIRRMLLTQQSVADRQLVTPIEL